MLRRLSNYLDQRPPLAIVLGFTVVFVLLYIAAEWDRADDTALRIQMMPTMTRGAT
jgi:hypothetical protein